MAAVRNLGFVPGILGPPTKITTRIDCDPEINNFTEVDLQWGFALWRYPTARMSRYLSIC